MTDLYPNPRCKPERIHGAAHLFVAVGYSIGGLRRLRKETAFRHILLALPVCTFVLALAGATIGDYCLLLILFLALIASEALNTAIECIVDHLSPIWAEFARDAKDLGSLSTMCLIVANGVFIVSVVFRAVTSGG
ncbi:diacylglycerol kinase [Sulfitobacter sp. BDSS02]|nr:diacylglycerol kinase [Sulfitobacter sp. BDSS02]MBR9852748.1 diacylglycerol kinase [Paracoccaceae bacterium]